MIAPLNNAWFKPSPQLWGEPLICLCAVDEALLRPGGLGENLGLKWDCMQVNVHKWVLAGTY